MGLLALASMPAGAGTLGPAGSPSAVSGAAANNPETGSMSGPNKWWGPGCAATQAGGHALAGTASVVPPA